MGYHRVEEEAKLAQLDKINYGNGRFALGILAFECRQSGASAFILPQ
jgi:hypothetical protein